MNPLVDDIFDLFPAWPYLSPSSLDYGDSLERLDRCHIDTHGQTQECQFLPDSMLEGYISNSALPVFAPPSLSSSLIPPTPTPSFNDLMNYEQEQEILISPHSSSSFSTYQKASSSKRNTRIGFCEHPKHVFYRQSHPVLTTSIQYSQPCPQHYHHHHENHCQSHICKKLCRHHHFLHHLKQQEVAPPNHTGPTATTPRRGRPPKGTKSSERSSNYAPTDLAFSMDHHHVTTTSSLGLLPVENDDSYSKINYHIPMTTRPLPKRLESVVGKSNIHVCLTCLKRSDMDVDYLMHPAYVGPQSSKKKKKVSSPNLA